MSYTNHTTNYNLPQYVGTDKPTYLGDFNTAMGAIDTQMKANADSASTANSSANTANTAIGTLASLTTDVKTDLVSAINEVDGHADTAQSTANSASGTASSALEASTNNATAIQNLASYLNLSVNNTYSASQFNVTSGSGNLDLNTNMYVARNASGTLCKIYGTIGVADSVANTSTTIKLNVDTGLKPDTTIQLVGTGFVFGSDGTVATLNVKLNTDGTVELSGYHATSNFTYRCIACLIFVKDFGDNPEA